MAKYRLLKDLPYARAGEVFERNTHKSKDGLSDYDYLEIKKRVKVGEDEVSFGIKYNYFLDNFDKWFEEIQEESTDSIHWKPKNGDEYFYISNYGGVYSDIWYDNPIDNGRLTLGIIYRTKEECKKAKERRLAEVILRQTSTFKPDFLNDNGGWVVFYNPREKKLETQEVYRLDYGELVRYETKEEAEKSIKENEKDWLAYFGIEERQ